MTDETPSRYRKVGISTQVLEVCGHARYHLGNGDLHPLGVEWEREVREIVMRFPIQ